jgi:sigma-B regulation protein RsbU (phosphoserine phosphatase)
MMLSAGGPVLSRYRLGVVVGVLALTGTFLFVGGGVTFDLLRRTGERGWRPSKIRDTVRAVDVTEGTSAARFLKRGDGIVAINGEGIWSDQQALYALERLPPGATYTILVNRAGRLARGDLRLAPYGAGWVVLLVLGLFLVRVVYWVMGIAVLAAKPGDKRAFLLGLLLALLVGSISSFIGSFYGISEWMLALLVATQCVCSAFSPVFLHFFMVFPEPLPLLRRFPALEGLIYLPVLPAIAMNLTILWIALGNRPLAEAFVDQLARIGFVTFARALVVGYLGLGLLALVWDYRVANAASRRKLRVVLAGNIVGFFPFLLIVLLQFTVETGAISTAMLRMLGALCVLTLPIAPLSFAYAIVRHQVLPVHLIVRRSVRYLLVSKGFTFVEAGVLAAIVAFLLSGRRAAFLDRIGHRADLVATLVVGAAVLGLLRVLNQRVMPAIDKRFFRDAYDSSRILAGLREAVRTIPRVPDVVERAAADIWDALHPASLQVQLAQGGGELVPVFSRAEAGTAPPARTGPPALDRDAQEGEDGGLVVPMAVKKELLGTIELGPRLGDLPYSREDRDLLQSVAWHMSLAIQNSRFVASMVEEERLRREIDLASEVQQRLFPEGAPRARGLDLAGACRPAQGVGGDYYDFLDLGDEQTGIAVADVAGKGISAALLMSVVQASLRSQARPTGVPLPDLVGAMNDLLYKSTARNRFASFFYAQFDPQSRDLSWVNAGHNPPLLLRAGTNGSPSNRETELLNSGGLVLGAVSGTTYKQESKRLRPGDVLVAYTDGVTEAWNVDEEEFGEDRLRSLLPTLADQPAARILEGIISAVDAWRGPAPQHDDITLIVAKVLN